MLTRLRRILLVCSALPCVATALLWFRTHHARDRVGHHAIQADRAAVSTHSFEVATYRGRLIIERRKAVAKSDYLRHATETDLAQANSAGGWYWREIDPADPVLQKVLFPEQTAWKLGFYSNSWESTSDEIPPGASVSRYFMRDYMPVWTARRAHTIAIIPLWPITLLFALAPTWITFRLVRQAIQTRTRRRREFNNLCPDCGYDLRHSPDRCPECGQSAPPRPYPP